MEGAIQPLPTDWNQQEQNKLEETSIFIMILTNPLSKEFLLNLNIGGNKFPSERFINAALLEAASQTANFTSLIHTIA